MALRTPGETEPVTIHADHPFATPEPERSPLRRWRGRMPAPVSVWTATSAGRRTGWTVSSFVLADGQPAEVLGLVDEDSDLAAQLLRTGRFTVNLLAGQHRALADVFADQAPAPGGPFTYGSWRDSEWGPVLDGAAGWLGARLVAAAPGQDHAGWALLVRGAVDRVELAELTAHGVLCSFRGRYSTLGATV